MRIMVRWWSVRMGGVGEVSLRAFKKRLGGD